MLRTAKYFGWLGLLALSAQVAAGFSLVGPKDTWQTEALGYSRLTEFDYPATHWTILSTEFFYAPKNINEGFRWAIPTLYYTYDPSFSTYFGSNGLYAVDSAFAILNNLKSVDSYSPDLSEFPLDEAQYNYTASALRLFDLKSAVLEMMMPRMGLADPERWTWCIRDRILPPGNQCPDFDFTVIQRNFDPLTWAPSKYVNGNLYTYHWLQFCSTLSDRSDPVEFLIDPTFYQTAVASPKITHPVISYYGMFHTGLTRDDAGGLRYLYSTNNVALEQAPAGTFLFNTNVSTVILGTSNLTQLAFNSLTNDPATLQGIYPSLQIAGVTNWYQNVYTTNITPYFTNAPWDPVGTPPHLAFVTNITAAIEARFKYTFGNVLGISGTPGNYTLTPITTLPAAGNGWVSYQTTVVALSNNPYGPVGSFLVTTNVSTITYRTNWVSGDYLLVPTNMCSAQLLSLQLTTLTIGTNVLNSVTNNVVINTNTASGTNIAIGTLLSLEQDQLTYITNRFFVAHPVTCDTQSIALRQGLQKITFVRRDFDSLIGRFFNPITNYYSMIAVTNSQAFEQKFIRVVTQPDILISGANLPENLLPIDTVDHFTGLPTFNNSNTLARAVGPGTIEGPLTLTFNDVGPIRLNSGRYFWDEETSIFYFAWGSFDGSTNAPMTYNGPTLQDLERQIYINVSPSSIPAGRRTTPYTVTLSVSGGTGPYSWQMTPGSTLPSGLSLVQDPTDSSRATITGAPTGLGQFLFTVRVTDAGARFVDAAYVLTVTP